MAISTRSKRFTAPSPRIASLILAIFFLVAVWTVSSRSSVHSSGAGVLIPTKPSFSSGSVAQERPNADLVQQQKQQQGDAGDVGDEEQGKHQNADNGENSEIEQKDADQDTHQNAESGENSEIEQEKTDAADGEQDEHQNAENGENSEIKQEEQRDAGIAEGSEQKQMEGAGTGNEGEDIHGEENSVLPSLKLCRVPAAQDYIPCLDNEEAIKMLPSRSHFEHRERHCPKHEDLVKCLVPLPKNYKKPVPWPKSRDEIWFDNVPHPGLVTYKKDQKWVNKVGDRLVFPGTGTQFILGAMHYIDYIERTLSDISWGKRTRVVLDVGCGVASFGGYLFQKDVLAMSFAPKDEHEAQVQLALERGIPAISSVMGTQRLVFPANVYDMVHCARCRVPWHENGGILLLEVNRVLRPGGYFVWSAPPVYRSQEDQVQIWKSTSSLAASMCWNQLARTTDAASGVGVAIFQKPENNYCYEHRRTDTPRLCPEEDRQDAAWYVPMKACIHKIPVRERDHGSTWPNVWPSRLSDAPPAWLNHVPKGLYGKPAAEEFKSDTEHWKRVIDKSYLKGLGLDWKSIRNVMDMKAAYGGFAAALISQDVWVMNVVPVHEPDTLAIIFDRGLVGLYHDWCESFSTYPRTYDLVHADHLLTSLSKRCKPDTTFIEIDRILRPEGYVIFRDKVDNLSAMKPLIEALRWKILTSYTRDAEELLVIQKQWWRPQV